jgi:hypothetical protein
MKQIRKGVFETNSSSTHSICIAKDVELTIPKSIYFGFGEFGWEHDTLQSSGEKASYLYTGLMANGRKDNFDNIIILLESKGIEVGFEEPIYKKYTYDGNNGGEYVDNGGYVDHSDQLGKFLNAVCGNEENLMNYLFSDLSFIITGNDNDESDVDINVDYPHEEFYKGN